MKALLGTLTPFAPWVAWGVAFSTFWALIGCGGGPPTQVQTALSVTARGVVQVDEGLAERYREAADSCYETVETRAAYDACIRGWDVAVDALKHTGSALRMAQLGHDSWESSGSEGSFIASAACLAAALAELTRALADLGVDVPDDIARAVDLVAPYAEGQCR